MSCAERFSFSLALGGSKEIAMAGRKFLDSPNLEVLLKNEGVQKSFFVGSWPLVNFEYDHGSSQQSPLFKPIELDDMADDDFDDYIQHPEKKRRLTTDQVQFLEQSFEFENKLEPERKLQIAKFLGLKPRQIAIWFQNRRARWKTKQLEKDYEDLKSSFDTLKLDHDFLLKEKELLQAEVLVLTKKLLGKEKNGNLESFELNKLSNKLLNSNSTFGFEVKPCMQEDIISSESSEYIDQTGYSKLMQLTSSSVPFAINNSDRSQNGVVDDAYELHATEQDLWLWT